MKRVLMSVAATVVLSGCAGVMKQGGTGQPATPMSAARYEQQMKMMQDMHQRMESAKTPQERAALMAEHMKAMQGGMSMMCEMGSGMGMQPPVPI